MALASRSLGGCFGAIRTSVRGLSRAEGVKYPARLGQTPARTMTHALSFTSPRTLAVLLSSLALASGSLGCNKDEQKKAEPTAATAGAAPVDVKDPTSPVVAAVVAPVSAAVDAVAVVGGGKIAPLSAEPEVLGHFAIANPSRLLADVKTQLVPAKYAGFLEEATLRSMSAVALDKRSNLALNYDMAAPLGCALVDPKMEDLKVGCTFGYKGGAKAFATDLGDNDRQADPAGHVAAYTVEGKSIFVDALGEAVVVSSGADTFAKTQAYLQRNIIGRAANIHGDLEVVVYVGSVVDRYRDQLAPLIDQMNATGEPALTGNPVADGAVKAWADYRKRSGKTTMERVNDFAQFTAFFSVEPAGVMMGGALFPKAGSRTAQEMQIYGDTKLDPAFAGAAPSGTSMLFAMHISPRVHETSSAIEGRKLMADVWSAVSGHPSSVVEAAIAAYQVENAALYDGNLMFALGREPSALFGLTVASKLASGKAARDSWKAWSTVFTPELVLGPEFSKFVTWKFKPDAATIDGVAVDRWTIEPTGEAKKKMEADMPADAKAFVDKALGGLVLNIDRAEVAGSVVFTVAPKAEAAYMKRAIAAFQGKGNVGSEPGLAKVLARDPDTAGILAVDLKEGMAWVRGMSEYGAKTDDVPKNIGTDLGDFYLTARYTKDGATAMEYVVAQQLIEQLKTMLPN